MVDPDPNSEEAVQERVEAMRFDFSLHSPSTPGQNDALDKIRSVFKLAGEVVIENTPYSREQSVALTELKGALHWACAAATVAVDRQREQAGPETPDQGETP